jgi:hypothetical protein
MMFKGGIFDALARMAVNRGKRVVILAVVLFGVAGALGGSVADRLDPYGARIIQDHQFESDFDRELKKLKKD